MVQYAPPNFTKDGRLRAPRHLIGPYQRIKRTPWPLLFGAVAAVGYLGKQQYDKLMQTSPQKQFLQKVKIMPYGVLGTQLAMTGSMRQSGPQPDEQTCIVDPAGMHHVKTTAAGAGGAAAAIYNFIGLKGKFPDDVVGSIHGPTDAKFHDYGGVKVIHAVGPDFRQGEWSEREAGLELSRAYRNALHEFVISEAKVLRVLPISSGIFSGPLYNQMPALTQEGLAMGFDQLHPYDVQSILEKDKRIELCIFMEREWDTYVQAFDLLQPPSKL